MTLTYIAYASDGIGCYLWVGEFASLQDAIDATPLGGKVEVTTEQGFTTIYP